MPKFNSQSGTTLVEILVTLVIVGVVAAGIYNLFRVHNLMAARQDETTRMQQELLSSLVQIAEDLRMCGYTTGAGNNGFNATSNATAVICSKDPDLSSNSTRLGYRFNAANNAIDYINATGGWEEAATNISNLAFIYFDRQGNIIPNISNATTASLVRAVDITVTAVASPERSQLDIGSRVLSTRVYCRNTGL